MFTKTLLMGFALAALLVTPSLAQNSRGSTASNTTLSKSDENFLSEMSDTDFSKVTGGNITAKDEDGDGIADSPVTMEDLNNAVTPKLPTLGESEEEKAKKANVQYVYKPMSDTILRRSVVDPRMGDDGYVQGLMQRQRGPQ